jgi:hypothetical protein
MKKTILSLIIFCFITPVFGQNAKSFFSENDPNKIYYLGIDYSHAKFIGDFNQFAEAGAQGMILIKNKYFDGWNKVVTSEPQKYNLNEMLRKDMIYNDLTAISEINQSTDIDQMEAENAIEYTKENIQTFVNKYKLTNSGYGIVFIAESLDKNRKIGTFHIAIINMETNKILIHDVFLGQAGGFGLRNYWARPVFEIIDQIRRRDYKKWKKEFSL